MLSLEKKETRDTASICRIGMAKIYLDTNFFIDIAERDKDKVNMLEGHWVYVSVLSFHVLAYVYKLKMPSQSLQEIFKQLNAIDLSGEALAKSFLGPTEDLEDNIQLHSAAAEDCGLFLTEDKELLQMKFFGKVEITDSY